MEKCCHVDGNTFCHPKEKSCYGDKQTDQEVFQTGSNSGKIDDVLYEWTAGATVTP